MIEQHQEEREPFEERLLTRAERQPLRRARPYWDLAEGAGHTLTVERFQKRAGKTSGGLECRSCV